MDVHGCSKSEHECMDHQRDMKNGYEKGIAREHGFSRLHLRWDGTGRVFLKITQAEKWSGIKQEQLFNAFYRM